MYILGINCYMHDSSACLLKDGVLIAFSEEELNNANCISTTKNISRH